MARHHVRARLPAHHIHNVLTNVPIATHSYLIITLIVSFIFASIAGSFYLQLRNPELLREQQQAHLLPSHNSGGAYPLNAYPPPGQQQHGPYAPSYGAPPPPTYAPQYGGSSLPGYEGPPGAPYGGSEKTSRAREDDDDDEWSTNVAGGNNTRGYDVGRTAPPPRDSTDTVTLDNTR